MTTTVHTHAGGGGGGGGGKHNPHLLPTDPPLSSYFPTPFFSSFLPAEVGKTPSESSLYT